MRNSIISLVMTTALFVPAVLAITETPPLKQENPATKPVDWTPVITTVPQVPSLFQGSDNKYNLVYEIVLTNYSNHAMCVNKCEIIDDKTDSIQKTLQGNELAGSTIVISESTSGYEPNPPVRLAPGGCAVVFVNIDFARAQDAPEHLAHIIHYSGLDHLGNHKEYKQRCASFPVSPSPPVVISSPLTGGRWVAGGGYSSKLGHRTALFAVGNRLVSSQRYAIDWLKLDEDAYSKHGDLTKNESCPAYTQPVVAVADGTVYGVVDRFSDQIPGNAVGTDRIAFPGGNYVVQDIGNGNFAFYAHLKQGSIVVRQGQKLKRGQRIGLVGNSGNSTGPHLHFHVTRGPEPMGSMGIPYVFDSFKLTAEVKNLNEFIANDDKGLKQSLVPGEYRGEHHNQLPREGVVVSFSEE